MKMRIHKTNDTRSEFKLIKYAEIQKIEITPETLQQKTKVQERWSFSLKI
jgi:hypothetical protein